MHIWKEIKNLLFRFGIYIFSIYVDIYIWVQKQDSHLIEPEPEPKEWICISSLYYNNTYDICNTMIDDYIDIETEYSNYYNRKKYIYSDHSYEVKEHLFIGKREDIYFIRTFYPGCNPCVVLSINQFSNVEFIYIEYVHPNMNYTIELHIPNGMFMVGNELFTPAFLLRLLQQQSKYYVFDLDYKINIMDHEIKNILLSCDSYILLNKNNYIIQSI